MTLRFDNDLVGVMIDRFGKDVVLRETDDQHCEVTVPVAVSEMFFGWISGLGPKVQILRPESVREQYRQELRDILEQYGEEGNKR